MSTYRRVGPAVAALLVVLGAVAYGLGATSSPSKVSHYIEIAGRVTPGSAVLQGGSVYLAVSSGNATFRLDG